MLRRVFFVALLAALAAAGTTPEREIDQNLLIACGDGDVDEARALLAQGADARVASRDGETPLHLAGIRGDVALVRLLVLAGGDVNARATGERSLAMTPLTWYLYGLHAEATQALLDAGADPNLPVLRGDGARVTALDLARRLLTNGGDEPDGAAARVVAAIEAAGGLPFADLPAEQQDVPLPTGGDPAQGEL